MPVPPKKTTAAGSYTQPATDAPPDTHKPEAEPKPVTVTPEMASLDRLRGWRRTAPPGRPLRDALAPVRAEVARMRRGRASVHRADTPVPAGLLSMAELLPIEGGVLRVRPVHAGARAAWSTWLRDGGEHALVRASGGAFTRVRLVVASRARPGARRRSRS